VCRGGTDNIFKDFNEHQKPTVVATVAIFLVCQRRRLELCQSSSMDSLLANQRDQS
jgi:hypothetical protein